MDKKEKYINFIVDDLVTKTEINYEQGRINFPFSHIPSHPFYSLSILFILSPFSKYIKERYGTRDEEINIIWRQYKERIQSLIKK